MNLILRFDKCDHASVSKMKRVPRVGDIPATACAVGWANNEPPR